MRARLRACVYVCVLLSGHRGPGLDAIENNMRLSSILVQAVKDHQSPLLQLPHFTMDSLRYMRTKKVRGRRLEISSNRLSRSKFDFLREHVCAAVGWLIDS